ncbi:uncharacterized protein LOC125657102 isoform X1 [Ostrea edulis]|uniref:uncharacterized protein LOC125657102 isoform X1 n=1 Tax=Ostrea edulis TaxID=37623 RepID=UPI002095F1F7|nr:uncharacterized protein LOC125657102 isoform X1 [Ostrea edulis]
MCLYLKSAVVQRATVFTSRYKLKMSKKLCLSLCIFLLANHFDLQTVHGYTLMQHLAQQANALQYGLNVAAKYNHRYGGSSTKVAFSARTSGNYGYSSGRAIKFHYVYTNQGLAFKNGQYFSAPHSGTYVFNWTIRSYSTSSTGRTSIRVNNYIRQQSNCYSKKYDSCTNTAVLTLNKGATVGIYSDSSNVYVASVYSSFSGWEL